MYNLNNKHTLEVDWYFVSKVGLLFKLFIVLLEVDWYFVSKVGLCFKLFIVLLEVDWYFVSKVCLLFKLYIVLSEVNSRIWVKLTSWPFKIRYEPLF
jgi:hypothetical protein